MEYVRNEIISMGELKINVRSSLPVTKSVKKRDGRPGDKRRFLRESEIRKSSGSVFTEIPYHSIWRLSNQGRESEIQFDLT